MPSPSGYTAPRPQPVGPEPLHLKVRLLRALPARALSHISKNRLHSSRAPRPPRSQSLRILSVRPAANRSGFARPPAESCPIVPRQIGQGSRTRPTNLVRSSRGKSVRVRRLARPPAAPGIGCGGPMRMTTRTSWYARRTKRPRAPPYRAPPESCPFVPRQIGQDSPARPTNPVRSSRGKSVRIRAPARRILSVRPAANRSELRGRGPSFRLAVGRNNGPAALRRIRARTRFPSRTGAR
jgi:hypothetical protein